MQWQVAIDLPCVAAAVWYNSILGCRVRKLKACVEIA